jgi:lysophospholipase L1-like esterase
MKRNIWAPLASLPVSIFASLVFLHAVVAAQGPTVAEAVKPIRAVKIILVGDSTTAVHSGWGGSFCALHVTSFVACVNLARGGRSTRSYREEGSWKLVLAEVNSRGFADTWILIQFGHNDQPGKPGRSTDLATEFPANLRRYVDEALLAGAHPILLTPLTRRQFVAGRLQNDLAAWAAAVAKVAEEKHVPLVDLNALSAKAVQEMGPAAANKLAQIPPSTEVAAAAASGTTISAQTGVAPSTPPSAADNTTVTPKSDKTAAAPMGNVNGAFDYTHLGRDGADYFAAIVTNELAAKVPLLSQYLVPTRAPTCADAVLPC